MDNHFTKDLLRCIGLLVGVFQLSASAAEPLVRTYLRFGEWELTLNDSTLKVVFEKRGTPLDPKHRVNQFAVFESKDGQQWRKLAALSASDTEQFSLPERWVYPLKSTSGKDYVLFILKHASDGEDPTSKPLVLITDGQTLQMKKFEIDEKYHGSVQDVIVELFAKISKEGMDDATKKVIRSIRH